MKRRPAIFYLAQDDSRPFGGEKHSYQHVDILNARGFEAYALHRQAGFRLRWFQNDTRTIDLGSFWDVYDRKRDFLVVPELYGSFTLSLPGRRVIFNKNLYYGYEQLGLNQLPRYPYTDPKTAGVFAVSEHNLQHLKFAFPAVPIFRMYAHIDTELFAFRPWAAKKPRIACVVKEKADLAALCHTLWARSAAGLNRLASFEWTFLQDFTEAETARVLGESVMVVALSTHEGLPRTVLEAMACGCIVVGYKTGPLKECLPDTGAVERDDFIAMARRVEEIGAAFLDGVDHFAPVLQQGRETAMAYSKARQEQHLVSAWEQILAGDDRTAG